MSSCTACDNCIHASECMERELHGRCSSYKNYEDIVREAVEEIARLNEELKGDGGE